MAEFLAVKSKQLQEMATLAIFRAGATRALASAMEETGTTIAELGVEEIAEGALRIEAAEGAAKRSAKLVEQGLDQMQRGESQMEWAGETRKKARKMAVKGVGQVAKGAEDIGAAQGLAAASEAL